MEHIIQFTIDFDDKGIQERLNESGYNDVVDSLTKEAIKTLPQQKDYFKGTKEIDWSRVIQFSIDKFMTDNKEIIIETAADKLYESFKRSKVFKEKMTETLDKGYDVLL